MTAPWYVRQAVKYGNPVFDRPTKHQAIWDRRPARFYVGLGLPDVVTDPIRPHFVNEAIPTTYSEVWGDYFGVWRGSRERQSILGLLPTRARDRRLARAARSLPAAARPAAGRAAAGPRAPRLPLLHRQLSDAGRGRAEGELHAHDGAGVGARLRLRGRPPPRALRVSSAAALLAASALASLPFLLY